MPQCAQPHPNSPNPNIFICIKEEGHEGRHYTYDANDRDYTWPSTKIHTDFSTSDDHTS